MKTYIFLTLFFLIPIFASSQINSSIDFVTGIDFSYRNISTSSTDTDVLGIVASRENVESGKMNWRIGLNYNKRLFKKIFLKTGLRLASVGYNGEKITDLRWGSEHDGQGGWMLDPTLAHELQFIHNYWFLEIPVVARYEFNNNKFTPFVELGVAPSIYLTTRTVTQTDISRSAKFQDGDILDFSKVHLVGTFSVGCNYLIKEKLQFFTQATYRNHFTRLAIAPIDEYLYNYGLEFGFRWSLGRE